MISDIVGATDTASAANTAERTKNRNQLSRQEFFKILTTQLEQQDPMSPMESENFLNQLVSLQSLDTTQQLSESLGGLVGQQEFTTASNILGRDVMAMQGSFPIEGRVDRVVQKDGQVDVVVALDLNGLSPAQTVNKDAVATDLQGNEIAGHVARISYNGPIPQVVLADDFDNEVTVPFALVTKVTTNVKFSEIKEIRNVDPVEGAQN